MRLINNIPINKLSAFQLVRKYIIKLEIIVNYISSTEDWLMRHCSALNDWKCHNFVGKLPATLFN